MRNLYTLILTILTPAILLRLLWKGLKSPAYWHRWSERFGLFPHSIEKNGIWLHAVSVGEVQAAIPLVQQLRKRYPNSPLIVTTTTPTGSEHARKCLGNDVVHSYIPYDLPRTIKRFLDRVQPVMLIVMETEIWPNLFYYCHQMDIPIVLANARLSERSATKYSYVSRLTASTLRYVSAFAVQARPDAQRLSSLGAPESRVRVTGNIKFDLELPASLHEHAQALRREWSQDRPVWIAASTREGEDEQVLDAFGQIQKIIPNILLVLVPRHPERFSKVASLCQKRGYKIILRSEHRECTADTNIFIGDSMGELRLFYGAADVAFVGGSLVARGGQNVLEPAAMSIPIIFGPHMFNFEEISQLLLSAKAARMVNNANELAASVISYLQNSELRIATGERAYQIVANNRGALAKVLGIIEDYLNSSEDS